MFKALIFIFVVYLVASAMGALSGPFPGVIGQFPLPDPAGPLSVLVAAFIVAVTLAGLLVMATMVLAGAFLTVVMPLLLAGLLVGVLVAPLLLPLLLLLALVLLLVRGACTIMV